MLNSITVLASGAAVAPGVIVSMMWIAIAALVSPLLSFLTGKRVPGVVFMLLLGVLIGPEVLDLAHLDGSNALLRELGLGMLFLLAGWEIDPDVMRGRQGRRATGTWLLSLGLAVGAALLLLGTDDLLRSIVLAIAVSSTAMGTLLPVIKNSGRADSPVGRGVLVHGAVGELGPVFAMALLLSTRTTWLTLIILALFMGGAMMVAFLPRTVSRLVPWVGHAVRDGASHTSQTVMRMVIVLLTTLMAMAAVFELDVVLGAFAAGIILRGLVPVRARKTVEARLDVMGYGLLIPVFFITSGMAINVREVLHSPWAVVVGIIVIYIARGLPILLMERFTDTGSGIRGLRDQMELSLYSATGLPIIVAVTEIAVDRGLLGEGRASVMVATGAATVLLFPMLDANVHSHVAAPEYPGDEEERRRVENDVEAEAAEYRSGKSADTTEPGAVRPRPRPKSSTVSDDEITIDSDED